tara:strand:- start:56 stop:505 length:450 start_codon:yes stop_codon:yes gene_type:complete
VFELPPDMPPAYPLEEVVEQSCISFNSEHFGIPDIALEAIRRVENGKVCGVNSNTNGTADLGPMQINTIHLPDIQSHYPDIDFSDVACKPCLNITISSWILSQRLNEVDGDLWLAVGNYHSKTPHVRLRYLKKIEKAVENIKRERSKGN